MFSQNAASKQISVTPSESAGARRQLNRQCRLLPTATEACSSTHLLDGQPGQQAEDFEPRGQGRSSEGSVVPAGGNQLLGEHSLLLLRRRRLLLLLVGCRCQQSRGARSSCRYSSRHGCDRQWPRGTDTSRLLLLWMLYQLRRVAFCLGSCWPQQHLGSPLARGGHRPLLKARPLAAGSSADTLAGPQPSRHRAAGRHSQRQARCLLVPRQQVLCKDPILKS